MHLLNSVSLPRFDTAFILSLIRLSGAGQVQVSGTSQCKHILSVLLSFPFEAVRKQPDGKDWRGRVYPSSKFQVTQSIPAGTSRWQDAEAAAHITATVESREMNACMLNAQIAFSALHNPALQTRAWCCLPQTESSHIT